MPNSFAARSAGAALVCLLLPVGSQALAQGIGYTITPAATNIRWTEQIGLENATLFGGQFAFDFPEFFTLEGYYFSNDGVFSNDGLETDISALDLSSPLSSQLVDQRLDVRTYGANLIANLGSGDISPFVKGGAGVVEFRPQSALAGTTTAGPMRQMALTAGAGVHLKFLDPLRIDLFAQDLMFRVNRYALAAQGTTGGLIPPDPEEDNLRHNLVLGAGIAIPFGGRDERPALPRALNLNDGLPGASFSIEPMVGRLYFDSDFAGGQVGDQELAGLRAGFDAGRYVGLRGFYWRGTSSNFTQTEDIDGWGAEAQFRLNAGTGITPYLLLGGAQVDFKEEFAGAGGLTLEDRTAGILGAGVAIPVADRFSINLAARDYIFDEPSPDESVPITSLGTTMRHNWMVTAGIGLNIGRPSLDDRREEALREARERLARARAMNAERADVRDSVTMTPDGRIVLVRLVPDAALERNDTVYVDRGDRMDRNEPMRDALTKDDLRAELDRRDLARTQQDLLVLTIRRAVREEVRDAAMRGEMRETAMRDNMREAAIRDDLRDRSTALARRMRMSDATPNDSLEARIAEMEETLLNRIDQMVAARLNGRGDTTMAPRMSDPLPRAMPANPTMAEIDARIEARVEARLAERIDAVVDQRVRAALARREAAERNARMNEPRRSPNDRDDVPGITRRESAGDVIDFSPRQAVMYSGAAFGVGQALIGGRVDLGPISRGERGIHLVPELAFGFGSGATSTMVVGNLQYEFGTWDLEDFPGITPHVGAGLGVLNFSDPVESRDGLEAVMNLGYGATIEVPWRPFGGTRPVAIVEHQGVDFFDLNRLLLGLQWSF